MNEHATCDFFGLSIWAFLLSFGISGALQHLVVWRRRVLPHSGRAQGSAANSKNSDLQHVNVHISVLGVLWRDLDSINLAFYDPRENLEHARNLFVYRVCRPGLIPV